MAASADNTATFAVDLNAQGAVAGANQAADALETLQTDIDDNVAALRRMEGAMRLMKGGTSVNIQAFQNLRKQIEAKKATVGQLQSKYLELGGTFRRTKKPVDDNADALKTLLERMQKGGGPVGGLATKLQGLRGLLAGGGALAAGAAAFALALVAVAAAAGVALLALAKYGIAAADAYRSERLQLEGLTKIPNWFGIAAGKAGEMQAALDRVSSSVALGREELTGMQASLYKVGFRGAALENALLGVATATAAAGEEGGAFAKQLFYAYGHTAAGAKRAADIIKARFGAVAAAQMLSLTVQSKKLHESFAALFTGLKLEGFLGGLKSVTDLFSQNTATGRALKQLLEGILQPLIDGATEGAPLLKRFMQGVILGAQEITIAYYSVRLALKDAFGDVSLFKNVDLLNVALAAGKIAVYSFAIGTGLLVAGFATLAAVAAAPVVAFYKLVTAIQGAASFLGSIDWTGLGGALIDGFVNGITAGIGKVVAAVKGVGNAALETLRGALDSHSPSRKGLNLGRTYPQGVGVGIERDLPLVQKAAKRVGITIDSIANDNAPGFEGSDGGGIAPAIGAPAPPAKAAAASASITINAPLTINIDGKGAPNDLIDEIQRVCDEQLRRILDGVATSMGTKGAA